MVTRENIDTLGRGGGDVIGQDGEKIGGIGELYVDDETNQPTWVTVKTGLFGTRESFVPLDGADVRGEDLVVPYTKDQVKDAPHVDPDGHLEPGEEDRLYKHYGRSNGAAQGVRDTAGTQTGSVYGEGGAAYGGTGESAGLAGTDTERTENASEVSGTGTVGRDTSGPATDDAMTRSEERLNVGTERQEVGRARLRKYVTTENVTKTVPVQREEVRVEREPITDENRGAALDGPDLSEEEHEVTLHEERPVVDKETVPVERVRLGTETRTGEETVNEEVAKEHIETDGFDEGRRP
ncbi:photosystem reaction center subunit H [Sinomonas atrocyanea]|uniref:Photosystem reaction center subunit H n=1 Tax=Sinomonas atrocyanea TaxID=37927 RepID=A0A127A3L3_9MICC|nr:PRC and DUF2382 domain-containing protein [Sinomonas atrocyanea]AMM33491.1 photosystem reaction center subunit H [Sinomonas atrocyanea]GEB62933.1 photosystem reaction center subunit H [Sinomonas atrocyanea]GGG62090.1 photosystem reaction center subunit H [Sinomonas atrocyanea]